jgi:hypothetical protein
VNLAAIAVGTPGCLLAVLSVIALIIAAFGEHPMWPHEPLNLAEAAITREEAEAVRLIEDGHDPNARYPVRAGLMFDRPTRLTPLEAAVARDDVPTLRQLLARGAAMDTAIWIRLRCSAPGERMPPVLDELRPAGATMQCAGVTAPWSNVGSDSRERG